MASPASSGSKASPRPGNDLPTTQEALEQLEHLPAPDKTYKRFTARNLELARLVSEELKTQPDDDLTLQHGILQKHGVEEVPEFDLRELVNPPSLQGVLDKGGWEVFGQHYPIVELSSSLADLGVTQLYDATQDRRDSLRKLLNTILVHYVQLLDELAKPPPGGGPRLPQPDSGIVEPPYQADVLIDQIRLACLNMHMLCNELRPMQARETLKTVMQSQIDRRRERTGALKILCEEAATVLAELRSRPTTGGMDIDHVDVQPGKATTTSAGMVHFGGDAWQRVTDAVNALT